MSKQSAATRKWNLAQLNAKTRETAWHVGEPWSREDLQILAEGIKNDLTTFEMAVALNRTLSAVMSKRPVVALALRHPDVIAANAIPADEPLREHFAPAGKTRAAS